MDTTAHPLNRAGRLRQLHGLARQAMAAYELPEARLTLYSDLDDIVYRVSVPPRPGHPLTEQYVLRLHATNSIAAIEFELLWLRDLCEQTDLGVPAPQLTRDGTLMTTVGGDRELRPYPCSLRQWMPGRRLSRGLTPARLTQVGSFMAALHMHAAAYQPPPGFVRPPWDWERFFGAYSMLNPAVARDRVSPSDLAVFTAFAAHVRNVFSLIGTGRDSIGLIHSDLQQSNYLFYKGQVQAIDFTDCGVGPYLFDMAVCISEAEDPEGDGHVSSSALRAAFLDGYTRVRPLPPFYPQHISTFLGLRLVDLVNWALSWPTLTARPWGPRFIPYAANSLRRYLLSEESAATGSQD